MGLTFCTPTKKGRKEKLQNTGRTTFYMISSYCYAALGLFIERGNTPQHSIEKTLQYLQVLGFNYYLKILEIFLSVANVLHLL